jgi:uncharacterized circularly permuted ATP-grasp superfamily protein
MSKEITLVVTEREHELFEQMVKNRINVLNNVLADLENQGDKVNMKIFGAELDELYGMEYLLHEANEVTEL